MTSTPSVQAATKPTLAVVVSANSAIANQETAFSSLIGDDTPSASPAPVRPAAVASTAQTKPDRTKDAATLAAANTALNLVTPSWIIAHPQAEAAEQRASARAATASSEPAPATSAVAASAADTGQAPRAAAASVSTRTAATARATALAAGAQTASPEAEEAAVGTASDSPTATADDGDTGDETDDSASGGPAQQPLDQAATALILASLQQSAQNAPSSFAVPTPAVSLSAGAVSAASASGSAPTLLPSLAATAAGAASTVTAEAPEAAQEAPSSTPATPVQQVVAVLARSVSTETSQGFTLQLRPSRLGTVEVHLQIDDTGKATAHFTADHPDALAALQQDQQQLVSALKQAGIETDSSSLTFSLSDQGGSAGNKAGDTGDDGSGSSNRQAASTLGTTAGTPAPRRSTRLFDLQA